MEARKVIIVNNKTQSQKTIMSNATTLGELKAEARAAGINIEDMTWYEGHMRAELKDDAAPLPATVMWKGTETTDLTFLLTQPEKKVKSGMDRAEVYKKIKELNLTEACKVTYGKNYTQVSTADLLSLIEYHTNKCESNCCKKDNTCNVEDAFRTLIEMLYADGILDDNQFDVIESALGGAEVTPMSKSEIDEMFDFV
jgi:hypothetical protein